jgi:hypothetical protein
MLHKLISKTMVVLGCMCIFGIAKADLIYTNSDLGEHGFDAVTLNIASPVDHSQIFCQL